MRKIERRPDHTADQPLGLLSDCHRRIEHFLEVLTAIGEQVGGGALTPGQREELGTALTYARWPRAAGRPRNRNRCGRHHLYSLR